VALPPSASITFTASGGAEETITAHDLRGSTSFQLWPMLGSRMTITLNVTKAERHSVRLEITEISHGLSGTAPTLAISKSSSDGDTRAVDVPINAACEISQDDNLAKLSRSTAVLFIGGSVSCTGTLIDHTSSATEPWLLTASHCADRSTGERPETMGSRVVARFNAIAPCGSDEFLDMGTGGRSISSVRTVYSDAGLDGTGNHANDVWIVAMADYPDQSDNAYLMPVDFATEAQPGDRFRTIHHAGGRKQQYAEREVRGIEIRSIGIVGGPVPARESDVYATTFVTGASSSGASGAAAMNIQGFVVGSLSSGSSGPGHPGTVNYNLLFNAGEQMLSQGILTQPSFSGRDAPLPRPTPPPATPHPTAPPGGVESSSGGGGAVSLTVVILLIVSSLARAERRFSKRRHS